MGSQHSRWSFPKTRKGNKTVSECRKKWAWRSVKWSSAPLLLSYHEIKRQTTDLSLKLSCITLGWFGSGFLHTRLTSDTRQPRLGPLIYLVHHLPTSSHIEEEGWRSRESACLPPMCPRFDFRTQRHMWTEFVGSLLCSKRFFFGYSGFPLSSKTNIWFDLIDLIWFIWFTVSTISRALVLG